MDYSFANRPVGAAHSVEVHRQVPAPRRGETAEAGLSEEPDDWDSLSQTGAENTDTFPPSSSRRSGVAWRFSECPVGERGITLLDRKFSGCLQKNTRQTRIVTDDFRISGIA